MSKTERVLESGDEAALDELDEFVASEAEAADVAIGELIDGVEDHVDDERPPGGNGFDGVDGDVLTDEDRAGSNGFDTSEVEADASEELETAEIDDEVAGTNGADADVAEEVAADGASTDVAEVVDGDGESHDEKAEGSYELPEIVPATVDDPEADEATAREGDLDEPVSDDIIEELRRADIDGPLVELAPQDDTTSARRRPKRRPDYDPAPVPIPAKPPRVLGRKPRVRKVTRVVRHVDPWSVFKIASIAFLVLYVVMLTASVLLWNVAHATGTVDNIERFFESFGWSSFEFKGGEIYHAAWIAGLFATIGLTGLAVLTATLFNLITDIVGGMRFTVLEEEVVETRTSPMRRFVVRRPEPEVPAAAEDSSGSLTREAVVDDSGAIERRTR